MNVNGHQETIQYYFYLHANSSNGTAFLLLFCIAYSQKGLQQWAKLMR